MLVFAFVVALLVSSTVLLLPSTATLDVSFESDSVEFQTVAEPARPLRLNLEGALVCGDIDASTPATTDRRCGARLDLSNAKITGILVPPAADILVRRTNAREVELRVTGPAAGSPIRVLSTTGETSANSVYVRVPAAFFDGGRILALGTLASMIRIGSPGQTFGETNGLLLVKGVATPLARSLFTDTVVRGDATTLNMGDVIDFTASKEGKGADFANLFFRIPKEGPIVGSARIPLHSLTIKRLGGSGIPVFISWWSRLLGDPVLSATWAIIGFLSAAWAIFGGVLRPARPEPIDPSLG